MLKVYNTLTNSKEEFKPVKEGQVKMYICGQTVYDNMHIGHGRTYISFDIIRRYLEYKGYSVETVINITDVNDKIDKRAEEEGTSSEEVSEKYTKINIEDFEMLGVRAEAYPKASEYVQEMIEMVEKLVERGLAYESNGNVFYNVKKFEDYGKLSNQDLESLESDRDDIKSQSAKKDPRDFVLWRSRKDYNGPTWDSPWGEGVPGWHIECSAMSTELLGEEIDIHGGGVDLVFPHHEDEIAQCEGATGKKPWVKYWMHAGLVRLKDEKMSKSLGNFVSTRELLEEYRPEVLRTLVASTHYRKPLDYSEKVLKQAKSNFKTVENCLNSIEKELNSKKVMPEKLTEKDKEFKEEVLKLKKSFEKSMNDDFNTSSALKDLIRLSKKINKYIETGKPNKHVLEHSRNVLEKLSWVLGVLPYTDNSSTDSRKEPEIIEAIIEIREEARNKKLYDFADKIREKLKEVGVDLEDTEKGVRWS